MYGSLLGGAGAGESESKAPNLGRDSDCVRISAGGDADCGELVAGFGGNPMPADCDLCNLGALGEAPLEESPAANLDALAEGVSDRAERVDRTERMDLVDAAVRDVRAVTKDFAEHRDASSSSDAGLALTALAANSSR